MSYNLIEPQYALLNQCEPCSVKYPQHASKMAGVTLGQYATAKIVNPRPETSPYSTKIDQIVSHLNAVNTENSQMQRSKSFLTGYNAGVAKF
jgi:hypothetical protein